MLTESACACRTVCLAVHRKVDRPGFTNTQGRRFLGCGHFVDVARVHDRLEDHAAICRPYPNPRRPHRHKRDARRAVFQDLRLPDAGPRDVFAKLCQNARQVSIALQVCRLKCRRQRRAIQWQIRRDRARRTNRTHSLAIDREVKRTAFPDIQKRIGLRRRYCPGLTFCHYLFKQDGLVPATHPHPCGTCRDQGDTVCRKSPGRGQPRGCRAVSGFKIN